MQTNTLKLDLGGAWSLQQVGKAAWMPATVPGNVHTDLMAAAKLADPHKGEHEAEVGWVEEADWVYRRRFDASTGLLANPRLRLVAEGLDTYATVWLNGKLLGRTENMFVEHSFDVSGKLKLKGNELRIRFDSPLRRITALEKRHGLVPAIGDQQRSYVRKAQYSFGWDWGPRLATSGVFAPIFVEALPDFHISDLYAETRVATAALASGFLHVEVDARVAGKLPLVARLGAWTYRGTVSLKKGLNKLKLPWRLARPKLWWPRGFGEPHRYQAEAALASGALSRCDVGIRVIELERKKDKAGESFGLKVNGTAVYLKGANWIPADSFLGRVKASRIQGLVAQAAESNMTLLRVWGGGIYENEAFYDACDREGLLVWQDFPFACNEVPELPWFVKLVKAEAEKAVRRLRRHASLALWCGNNENQMGRHDGWYRGRENKRWGTLFYNKVLPEICGRLDPATPYWPGSPYGGKDPNSQSHGDRHNWLVWAQFQDYNVYREDHGRFISEFGFAALPNRALLKSTLAKDQRWLQSRAMTIHDKVERGGAYSRIAYYIMNNLPFVSGLDNFRYLSQVNQGEALRTGIEHWRRNKPHTQGAVYWQLNDCWPVTCWSVLDSNDTPKLAYYRTKMAFDDALLSVLEADAKLLVDKVGRLPLTATQEDGRCEAWLTLDGKEAWSGSLTVERWNMNGKQARVATQKVSVAANQSKKLWSKQRKACGITDPSREYLVFRLTARDGRERQALLFFERPRRLNLEDTGLVVGARVVGSMVEVAVRARHLTLGVELHAPVAGRFSDNGFDVLPGETRLLTFIPEKEEAIKGAWSALSLNRMQVLSRLP